MMIIGSLREYMAHFRYKLLNYYVRMFCTIMCHILAQRANFGMDSGFYFDFKTELSTSELNE